MSINYACGSFKMKFLWKLSTMCLYYPSAAANKAKLSNLNPQFINTAEMIMLNAS